MRKVLISVTPLVLSLAAFGQTAGKPAAAPSAPSTGAAPAQAVQPAVAQPAAPEHPLTDAQAHELMELTGTDKIKDQLIANATTYFKRAFPPYMPNDVLEDITASLQKADVNTPVVAIYKKYLSTEAAAKAIDFYRTPAGKDLIKATPQILTEAQRSAGATAQQIVKDVMDRHKTEIDAAQKTYQEQHAAPTLGPGAPGATSPGAKTPGSTNPGATPPKPTPPQG